MSRFLVALTLLSLPLVAWAEPPDYPGTVTYLSIDPDQAQAAANIPAATGRASVCCQNVGTTAARVTLDSAGGATGGLIIAPGLVAGDGFGGQWCSPSPSKSVWFYDSAGAGTADLRCEVATW